MSASALMDRFETLSREKGGYSFVNPDTRAGSLGQNFFKELLTQQLGADTFKQLAGGDIDKFLGDNVTELAMRGGALIGDYEDEQLGKIASSLIDQLMVSAVKNQNRASIKQRELFVEKKASLNDFTINANPADTLMVQGGTQIGNDVIEKLDAVIDAINSNGGDIIMNGEKVGKQIARTLR